MSLTMSTEEREAFLAGLHVGIVGIPRKTKGPLTVPIWYDYRPGGDVSMIMSESSLKAKLLANTDRISLCAQTEKPPYRYVSIEGPFTVDKRSEEQMLHMAVRYLGDELGAQYAASSAGGDESVVVSITPETWYTVDYNKR